jgi:CRP-like cAMP-binding protein
MNLPIPVNRKREHRSCNVSDCLISEKGALLACMELTGRVRQCEMHENCVDDLDAFGDELVVIVGKGAISLEWALGDGRRQVVGFMFRGDILTPIEGGPTVRAMALSDGVLYLVDTDVIAKCRSRQTEGRDWRTALIGARLADATSHTLMLGQMTAIERVVSFLLGLAERTGKNTNGEVHLNLPMSRQHIADHLGLKPETVSRQFSELRCRGIIRLPKPGQVEIADIVGLDALSPLASAVA